MSVCNGQMFLIVAAGFASHYVSASMRLRYAPQLWGLYCVAAAAATTTTITIIIIIINVIIISGKLAKFQVGMKIGYSIRGCKNVLNLTENEYDE